MSDHSIEQYSSQLNKENVKNDTLYLSFDVETDGNNPYLHNLKSLGIYGLDCDLNNIFSFEANIKSLPNHTPEENCLKYFWLKEENKKAYEYINSNQKDYIDVFTKLSNELTLLANSYKLVFIASPAAFDWMFLKCYYELAKSNCDKITFDIGFNCKCGSTQFNIYKQLKKLSDNSAQKLKMELGEFGPNKNKEHTALYDAKCQGLIYVKIQKLLQLM